MALFGSSDSDLQHRVDMLERRVAALEQALRHAGVEKPPAGPLAGSTDGWISAEVRELAASGKTINAIKLLRDQTGLGLKEAKDAVERL
jgi:ribosomal protein L7/L12